MNKFKVAILGATGTVGQRICSLLSAHPWFEVSCLTGGSSAGKIYDEAVNWVLPTEVPEKISKMRIESSEPKVVEADFVFSALPSKIALEVEPLFAKEGFAVVSNASAYRMMKDIPLVVPEVNPEHIELIEDQRRNRTWEGFISTDPNCSTINLVLALKPIQDNLRIKKVVVTTMQAISGAGYPGVASLDILDNVIPYIEGEEEKMQKETLKVLGTLSDGYIKNAPFHVSAFCNRIPVVDGHLETLYVETEDDVNIEEVKKVFRSFKGVPQKLKLPTAPDEPIIVREEADRPQTRLDRMAGSFPGMSITLGKLRRGIHEKSLKVTILGHNTIRGAAGGAILLAELLVAKHWIKK